MFSRTKINDYIQKDSINFIKDDAHIESIKLIDFAQYPLFIGIAMFSVEGNPMTLSIRASMKQPEKFEYAFYIAISIACVTLCIVGSLGYLAFGNQVEDIILLNLSNNGLTLVAKSLYNLVILSVYPVVMIIFVEIVEDHQWYQNIPTFKRFDIKYYAFRTSYVILTGFLAIYIPKIGLFMSFVGSVTCTSICFVFPVLIYEKTFKDQMTLADKMINAAIIIIGLLGGGIASIISLIELIQAF